MTKNAKSTYWILALLAAISFDLMFWKKPGGINFFLFITLAVLGILIPLWLNKVRIPWTSTLLLVPAGFFRTDDHLPGGASDKFKPTV